jgi:hypothetical protein
MWKISGASTADNCIQNHTLNHIFYSVCYVFGANLLSNRKYLFSVGDIFRFHVRRGPCQHGMASPRVADGGTASKYEGRISSHGQMTRGGPPSSGLGVGLTTLHHKIKFVTNNLHKSRTRADSLDKQPKLRNMDMRFGTWNVRSFYRAGSLKTVSREIGRYKLGFVGVQEVS